MIILLEFIIILNFIVIMVRKCYILIIIVFFFGLSNCEYNLHEENFRDIDPPPGTHEFMLTFSPENDTIEVLSNMEFSYELETFGLEISGGNFTIDNYKWEVNSSSGRFTVRPGDFDPGYYKLTMEVFAKSGTGSLQDYIGAEGYMVNKEWVLLIDDGSIPEVAVTCEDLPNGYFQISWSRADNYKFSYYLVERSEPGGTVTWKITDEDKISMIDSCFIGGLVNYTVRTYIDNGTKFGQETLHTGYQTPMLQFENIGVASLKFSWEKSDYNVRYILKQGIDTIFESTIQSSFIIPSPGFGANQEFTLITISAEAAASKYGYAVTDSRDYVLGENLYHMASCGYNQQEDVVYTNLNNLIVCQDITTLATLTMRDIGQANYKGMFSCPSGSSKVAALLPAAILLFNDKTLLNPVTIPYNCNGMIADHFYMTDNDIITVALPEKFQVISITDKTVLATIPVDDYPAGNRRACFSTSKNGNYAAVATSQGIKLYSIENGSVSLIYSDARTYRSVLFDINDPGKLMLTFRDDNKLEIRNIQDFSLDRTVNLTSVGEALMNTDPETGNLLLTDFNDLHIIDPDVPEEVLKIHCQDSIPRLYKNRLFSYSGYTLNIAPYLNK